MSTPLARFFASNPTTSHGDLARRLGVTENYVWRLAHGKRSPGLKVAHDLERATGGAVKATDWLRPIRRRAAVR